MVPDSMPNSQPFALLPLYQHAFDDRDKLKTELIDDVRNVSAARAFVRFQMTTSYSFIRSMILNFRFRPSAV